MYELFKKNSLFIQLIEMNHWTLRKVNKKEDRNHHSPPFTTNTQRSQLSGHLNCEISHFFEPETNTESTAHGSMQVRRSELCFVYIIWSPLV